MSRKPPPSKDSVNQRSRPGLGSIAPAGLREPSSPEVSFARGELAWPITPYKKSPGQNSPSEVVVPPEWITLFGAVITGFDPYRPAWERLRVRLAAINESEREWDGVNLFQLRDMARTFLAKNAGMAQSEELLDELDGLVLRALARASGALKFVDLAEHSNVSISTCKARARKLEDAGLVMRRSKRGGVAITDAGKARVKEMADLPPAD